MAAATAAASCGGTTSVSSVTGPDQVRCQTQISADRTTLPADGGTFTVTIGAARDCTWTASSDVPWVQLNATSGQGEGTLTATAARNELTSPRTGAVVVNDQRLSVSQEARPCTFRLRAASTQIGAGGGRGAMALETLDGCAWQAETQAPWLRVLTPTGRGSATIEFEAQPNPGPRRDAAVTVGGQRFLVEQGAAGSPDPAPVQCVALVRPTTIDLPAEGGSSSVTLEWLPSCDWTAASESSWIAITSARSGTGNATVRFAVERNTGAARTGALTVAQQRVTVAQAAQPAPTCTYSIEPSGRSFSATGGEGTVRVVTQAGCEWTASSRAAWVSVSNGRGTGTGDVRYVVQAHTGTSSRSTSLDVAGRTHSVSQSAAAPTCTFTLQPTSLSFGANGGEGRFTVSTQAGCQWSASGGAGWVTVGTSSGTGPGDVGYTVQANGTASTRSTAITVNGQSHAVSQAAAAPTCTFSLQPASSAFAASGGQGRFTVATQAGCQWSASSGAGWAAISAGSGTGSGDVVFTVQANADASARSTVISVNGQTHAVSQEAAAPTCTYSLQPGSLSFGASGGEGRFTVGTQAGCQWSASSGAGWATVSAGSGSGPGEVVYAVQANADPTPRSTSIMVNGQAHGVSQAAAAPTCTYSLQPGSLAFGANGGEGRFTVMTQAGCQWSASGGATWAVVTAGSGTGPGDVVYTVQANSATTARSTSIAVGGQTHGVSQEAAPPPPPPQACTYAIDPEEAEFGESGGQGTVRVITQSHCTWSASTSATWVTLLSSSGTGTGEVRYQVAANSGDDRSATVTIAGLTHRVEQEEDD